MDVATNRALTSQLVDDLDWLEQHCRRYPEQAMQTGQVRLAASLVRNCAGPFLDNQPATPLHIAVVGGAGAGKSTIANFLTGAGAAEANPQAGFTRHPIGYTSADGPLAWAGHKGFLGPLQRQQQACPANLDADVYQVRRILGGADRSTLLANYVVWDCPDMTTWAATGYVPRLLEVAGLADVLIYVASDERYNDEVPTQFLHLLLQTGKPVIACIMKMREADAPALLAHFQQEVVCKMPRGIVACMAIPHLTPEQLADPVRLAGKYRIPLLNQVAVLGEPNATARRRTVYGANRFLIAAQESLLGSAREDVLALQGWREMVQAGEVEFDQRYRREYLNSKQFRHFDEALVRLLDLLELPGVGQIVSKTLWVLRTPYRLLRGWVGKAITRPAATTPPEQSVLDQALTGWLDLLHKEAARRAGASSLWAHVEQGFDHNLAELTGMRFKECYRAFQMSQADEVDRTARAIYEELEKSPVVLNTLRGGKLAIDIAAIIGAVVAGAAMGVLEWIFFWCHWPPRSRTNWSSCLARVTSRTNASWPGSGSRNSWRSTFRGRWASGWPSGRQQAAPSSSVSRWPCTVSRRASGNSTQWCERN